MAITASIVAAVGVGFGAAELFNSSTSKGSQGPAQAALPDQKQASVTASSGQNQNRLAALAAGGLTDYTQGGGIVLGSDVKSAGLVGG